MPALVFVIANVLQHEMDVHGAASWLEPMLEAPATSALVTVVVALGPLLAVVLTLSWMVPLRAARSGDAWQVTLRVRTHPFAIAVLVISLGVGIALLAYLVAENAPCVLGLASSC